MRLELSQVQKHIPSQLRELIRHFKQLKLLQTPLIALYGVSVVYVEWVFTASQYHIHDDTNWPDIHAFGVLLFQCHLWSHVYQRPALHIHILLVVNVILKHSWKPEVYDLTRSQIVWILDQYIIYTF